eukprot:TRINITY_DN23148_c0_g1_i1.p1 TRINITY_DN23148_c0_g1~~TRINITY_DN23148_c0_g1_i1.p1  ORF type:complete len:360 (+),score=57.69 TRINITY_DN23148_c0_g1_i1:101-1180(+)
MFAEAVPAGAGRREVNTDSGHADQVHDIQLSYDGRRIATCSTDRTIRVWDLGDDGFSTLTSEIKGHTAGVTRICWSHPAFGQILASCGLDKTVNVWQEQGPKQKGKRTTWRPLYNRVHTEGPQDIAFAPLRQRLKLAIAQGDGVVRVLSACGAENDQWEPAGHIEVPPRRHTAGRASATCVCWNPSCVEERDMLVLGTDCGRVLVCASEGGAQPRWSIVPVTADGGGGLDSLQDGCMEHQRDSYVTDVAWAPQTGRSYHLIASCSRVDGAVKIVRLSKATGGTGLSFVAQVLFKDVPHDRNSVWRVRWNLTGTILATSGDDGVLRLWKRELRADRKWVQIEQRRAGGDVGRPAASMIVD